MVVTRQADMKRQGLPALVQVDVSALAHGKDKDDELCVLDLVDDPIVTGADALIAVAACELLGIGRPCRFGRIPYGSPERE